MLYLILAIGLWASWVEWSDCQSTFCGSTGIQLRSRSCVYRYNNSTLKDNCAADGYIAFKELRVCTEPCNVQYHFIKFISLKQKFIKLCFKYMFKECNLMFIII